MRATQTFTHKIVSKHREQDSQTRIHGKPGRRFNGGLSLHEHIAPAWHGRLHAKPEKTQARLHKNGARNAKCGGDQHRRERIGEDMAQQDLRRGSARKTRRGDKFTFAQAQGLGTHKAAHAHPGGEADDDHDIGKTGFQKGNDREDQKK